MDYQQSIRNDIEAGQRVQERIQFFFLTLTFTILSLAIETHSPGKYPISSAIELFSWVVLIISAIAGLYRMHLIPKYYKLSIHINALNWNIKDAEDLKRKGINMLYLPKNGKEVGVDVYIDEHKKGVSHFSDEEIQLTNHLKPIVRTHEIGLIIGIIFLAFARAYETIIFVFCT